MCEKVGVFFFLLPLCSSCCHSIIWHMNTLQLQCYQIPKALHLCNILLIYKPNILDGKNVSIDPVHRQRSCVFTHVVKTKGRCEDGEPKWDWPHQYFLIKKKNRNKLSASVICQQACVKEGWNYKHWQCCLQWIIPLPSFLPQHTKPPRMAATAEPSPDLLWPSDGPQSAGFLGHKISHHPTHT